MGRLARSEIVSACGKITLIAVFFCLFSESAAVTRVTASSAPLPVLHTDRFSAVDRAVGKAIQLGQTPGAVVLIGDHAEVVYHRAFGYRTIEPERTSMTEDTIFDLASLTKVVATTTAIMQLAEKKKLDIGAPAARYWPAFGRNGKRRITLRQLLTHYSGLRPDLGLYPAWSGYEAALRRIIAERPVSRPGTRYIYSDINFEVLGEIVRRVSGQPLDRYCAEHVFGPLGMTETGFLPAASLDGRIAPTEYLHGRLLCGEPHDPSCYRMGGVAGHAGLFSTASDLSLFARMLLNKGSYRGVRILNAGTVKMMTSPESPRRGGRQRGFGWDIVPSFAAVSTGFSGGGAYGHLGYTGTALWIDPSTDTFVIVLTNRVHPDGKGDIRELRTEIRRVVSEALLSPSAPLMQDKYGRSGDANGAVDGEKRRGPGGHSVLTGIDVLAAEDFLPLRGLRIGLITNLTGVDSEGRSTIQLLRDSQSVSLKAIFSPEHGLSGTAEGKVATTVERATGLPVYSLYGNVRKPTGEMLKELDALVFDIQDAGVRFYTYISTLGYAMESAAEQGVTFYVLDRPNPLNAVSVQGPVLDKDLISFTGYFPLPLRHGMTVGELARMFNDENRIGADLHVIRMSGYNRADWFDQTGLAWVNPSPNLRSLTEAALYPGVAMVEGANVSVGRGTDSPFELLGAPWIEAKRLAGYLNGRDIAGVAFEPADFRPKGDRYKDRQCHGVRISVTDREALDVASLGVEIVGALYKLYPADFWLDRTLDSIGSRAVMSDIRSGAAPRSVSLHWQESLARFLDLRSKYLLY